MASRARVWKKNALGLVETRAPLCPASNHGLRELAQAFRPNGLAPFLNVHPEGVFRGTIEAIGHVSLQPDILTSTECSSKHSNKTRDHASQPSIMESGHIFSVEAMLQYHTWVRITMIVCPGECLFYILYSPTTREAFASGTCSDKPFPPGLPHSTATCESRYCASPPPRSLHISTSYPSYGD